MLLNVVGSIKMDNNEYKCSLTVVDVYDIAQEIGREFESLIDAYGTDAITGLMPKVVTALEQMEILAMRNERENTTVDDLRSTIQQLEMDKQDRTEDRIKYEKVIINYCVILLLLVLPTVGHNNIVLRGRELRFSFSAHYTQNTEIETFYIFNVVIDLMPR